MRIIFFIFLFSSAFANPINVIVSEAKSIKFEDNIEALGTLKANENVNLSSSVLEKVIKINFDDNQRVKKGDLLIEMNSAEEKAQLNEEKSRKEEAQKQVNRLRKLVKTGASAQTLLDEQIRDLKSSLARIAAIESRIKEKEIIAPFDGVVGIREISVGVLATPGDILVTIDDDTKMKLDFLVPEIYISSLNKGINIDIYSAAYPNKKFNGVVSSIDSRVDEITRAIKVRAIIDNKDKLLKSGMLMRVILRKDPRDAIIIPEEAILKMGKSNFVMKAQKDEKVEKTISKKQKISIGGRKEGIVEVTEGLNIGDLVVTHGLIKVRDGSEITIEGNNDY